MQYLQKSFSVPQQQLKNGKNRHGQTWEDIFSTPSAEAISDATGYVEPQAGAKDDE